MLFRSALERIGLGGIVGQSAELVMAAIANALAPDGSSLETSVARKATTEVLETLYDRYVSDDNDISALEQMDSEDVRKAIEESVASYVFDRWLQELGLSIENGAISEHDAVRLERELKAYVRENVRLTLRDLDPPSVDWSGQQGRRIVDRPFQDAYSMLEA